MAKVIGFGESGKFDIEKLRADVASGKRPLRITSHAQIEAFKDGLLLADLRYVFERGEVIEIYPDNQRGLLHGILPECNLPAHIVVEDTPIEGVIVTAYIPDKGQWIANVRRKGSKGKKR
ncbi:MAG: DUF4258 domain-containing protein [Anaerolineae bacterium]|nr:DUF4258 domain-containing protein [Anaerolineae bacterium]